MYALGGFAYAFVMALAQIFADGLTLLPIPFSFLFWVFAWPVVMTTGIVAAATRLARMALAAAYFAVLFAIGAMAMPFSPDLAWGQVVQSWALNDLPPTVLMFTYLSRRVRAVGPLVLIFMTVALAGSTIVSTLAASDEGVLRGIVSITGQVGLGGVGTFWALLVIGFLMFGVVGWAALGWIRRQ